MPKKIVLLALLLSACAAPMPRACDRYVDQFPAGLVTGWRAVGGKCQAQTKSGWFNAAALFSFVGK